MLAYFIRNHKLPKWISKAELQAIFWFDQLSNIYVTILLGWFQNDLEMTILQMVLKEGYVIIRR